MTLKSDMQKPEPFLNPKALSAKARTRKPFNPKPPLLGVPGLASAVEWMVVPGQSWGRGGRLMARHLLFRFGMLGVWWF